MVALGVVQAGPYGPVRTVLATAAVSSDLAAAGDCPVSATIVASKLAVTRPVTRRRFPLNIELRIDKSPVNNSLIVTENFPCPSPSIAIWRDLDETWVNLLEGQDFWREIATYDG